MNSDEDQPGPDQSLYRRLRRVLIGGARSPQEAGTFHKISLIAFFAWVGLGADGLSSSCYGPEAAFNALGTHPHLGIFVALATAITIFVISSSYSQLVEIFPSGGGGYLVASKLLSPGLGLIAGCALMVDYVLTITTSIAAGAYAIFSYFPDQGSRIILWGMNYRLAAAVAAILILTLLNLRGVRESVATLVPIFMVFVVTHIILIATSIGGHLGDVGQVVAQTGSDISDSYSQVGLWAMILLMVKSFSMGAGTYTGIEAISNGMPVLREPRVQTAKRTITYMWISLAVTVVGLMLSYLLLNVRRTDDLTLNAVLLQNLTSTWPPFWGSTFMFITLASEAAILFVAAQTGFLGGPRVLASMAQDRWFPVRLSMLSDRLVTQNGVLLMAAAALATLLLTQGKVEYLLVLYSINVFITFVLSQAGMVRHWYRVKAKVADWRHKITINGIGLTVSAGILVSFVYLKFWEGGWVTLVVTTVLVTLALLIKRHYNISHRMVRSMDRLCQSIVNSSQELAVKTGRAADTSPKFDPAGKTAVLLVSSFNGLGLHSLLNVIRFFGGTFRNFVFLGVGAIDAGNFKGIQEVERLKGHVENEVQRYVTLMHQQGYFATGMSGIGPDVVDEIAALAPKVLQQYPGAIFFAGQLVFPKDTVFTRILHNNIAFAAQQRLYRQGVPFVILPFQVQLTDGKKDQEKPAGAGPAGKKGKPNGQACGRPTTKGEAKPTGQSETKPPGKKKADEPAAKEPLHSDDSEGVESTGESCEPREE